MWNVFAIIQTGGRQIRVDPGAVVTVDRVEAEVGKEITFDQVLFLEKDGGEMLAGAPFVANANRAARRSWCSRRSAARDSARRAATGALTRASASLRLLDKQTARRSG